MFKQRRMNGLVIIYCQLVLTTLDISNRVLCSDSILNPHKRKEQTHSDQPRVTYKMSKYKETPSASTSFTHV